VAPASVDTSFHGAAERREKKPSMSAETCAKLAMDAFDACVAAARDAIPASRRRAVQPVLMRK
jgi:hypothetical protein